MLAGSHFSGEVWLSGAHERLVPNWTVLFGSHHPHYKKAPSDAIIERLKVARESDHQEAPENQSHRAFHTAMLAIPPIQDSFSF